MINVNCYFLIFLDLFSSSNSKSGIWTKEKEIIKGKKIDFDKVIADSAEEDSQPKQALNSNSSGFSSIPLKMKIPPQMNPNPNNDVTKPAPSYDISSLAPPIRGPVIISQIRGTPPPICTCTKTGCKKKYCACYQKGFNCNSKCECKFCENNKQEDFGIVYGKNCGVYKNGLLK